MMHLQELPDHGHLEDGAYATRRDDERVDVVGLVYLAARSARSVAGSGPSAGAQTTPMRSSVTAGR